MTTAEWAAFSDTLRRLAATQRAVLLSCVEAIATADLIDRHFGQTPHLERDHAA